VNQTNLLKVLTCIQELALLAEANGFSPILKSAELVLRSPSPSAKVGSNDSLRAQRRSRLSQRKNSQSLERTEKEVSENVPKTPGSLRDVEENRWKEASDNIQPEEPQKSDQVLLLELKVRQLELEKAMLQEENQQLRQYNDQLKAEWKYKVEEEQERLTREKEQQERVTREQEEKARQEKEDQIRRELEEKTRKENEEDARKEEEERSYAKLIQDSDEKRRQLEKEAEAIQRRWQELEREREQLKLERQEFALEKQQVEFAKKDLEQQRAETEQKAQELLEKLKSDEKKVTEKKEEETKVPDPEEDELFQRLKGEEVEAKTEMERLEEALADADIDKYFTKPVVDSKPYEETNKLTHPTLTRASPPARRTKSKKQMDGNKEKPDLSALSRSMESLPTQYEENLDSKKSSKKIAAPPPFVLSRSMTLDRTDMKEQEDGGGRKRSFVALRSKGSFRTNKSYLELVAERQAERKQRGEAEEEYSDEVIIKE